MIVKFRAWNKTEKKMLYDIQEEYDTNIGELDSFDQYLNNPNYIVMQYTGLKDKNGKEIYEGDIIRYYRGYGSELGKIIIFECGYRLYLDDDAIMTGSAMEAYSGESFEVIGNIYENPDLLDNED